jgi:transposase
LFGTRATLNFLLETTEAFSQREIGGEDDVLDFLKAYDCAAFRGWFTRRGTTTVIPNKINRRKPYPHNKRAYRHRNKIERMFCRLKDARRIATRYDKCANNFLSAVCLVALIYFWLN